MINFFRKTRKKMADDNKPMKYLRYAIGEIVLVVVGILIALQINNWSENQKKQEFEITILKNIQEDILADKIDFELNLQYLKVTFKNEDLLLNFLLSDNLQITDSINYVNVLGLDLIAITQNTSFNNLQNNDIGLVSNNNLYKKIARYYDFYASGISELEKHDSANTYDEKFIYFKKHFKIINKKTKLQLSAKNTWSQEFNRYNFTIKNIDKLKKDEEFKLVLAESEFITSTKITLYQQILETMEELHKSIDRELKTLR
ncbi:MAG: DUF6090 family protein [Flavobacteriaceae bacterium]